LVETHTWDEDLKALKLLNRPFFDGYTQARPAKSSTPAAARRNRPRRKFRQDWK
jgi:hypothetical protein